jgi:hypothetical protein
MSRGRFCTDGCGNIYALVLVSWNLLAVLACKAPAQHEAPTSHPNAVPDSHQLPDDVAGYLSRLIECHHWAGEEPYNEERRKEIQAAAEHLACDSIEADERSLRSKYQGNREVLEKLDTEKAKLFSPRE